MITTASHDYDGPSRGPQRLVVTTTSRREVRRPSRVLTDFQQIELLSTLMAKTTELAEVQVYESKTLSHMTKVLVVYVQFFQSTNNCRPKSTTKKAQ